MPLMSFILLLLVAMLPTVAPRAVINTTTTIQIPHLPNFNPDLCSPPVHNPWSQQGQRLGVLADYNATVSSNEAILTQIPDVIKCGNVARFIFPQNPGIPYWTYLPRIALKPSSYYIATWRSSRRLTVTETKQWPHQDPVDRYFFPRERPYKGLLNYHGENIELGFFIDIKDGGYRINGEVALSEVPWPRASEPETE